jgi:hypothetical protein
VGTATGPLRTLMGTATGPLRTLMGTATRPLRTLVSTATRPLRSLMGTATGPARSLVGPRSVRVLVVGPGVGPVPRIGHGVPAGLPAGPRVRLRRAHVREGNDAGRRGRGHGPAERPPGGAAH